MAFALSAASIATTFADTAPTTTASGSGAACSGKGWGGRWRQHHDSVLTEAERAQLHKARTAALAANGTLQTEKASLKQQFEALRSEGKGSATPAQWQALHQQALTFHQNLKSAELLIDPTLAPIFAKLEAAHQGFHGGWHHHFGSATSTTSGA